MNGFRMVILSDETGAQIIRFMRIHNKKKTRVPDLQANILNVYCGPIPVIRPLYSGILPGRPGIGR